MECWLTGGQLRMEKPGQWYECSICRLSPDVLWRFTVNKDPVTDFLHQPFDPQNYLGEVCVLTNDIN